MTWEQQTPIYTIGYGARSLEEFITLLKEHRIAFVLDIRTAPYSRYKPEFSKAALEAELARHGFRYIYMGDVLGGQPDDPDCYVNGKVNYDAVKQKDFYRQGIARLQKAFAQQHRVMLMCSVGKPEICHRIVLIGESLDELCIPIIHIDWADLPRTQA